MQGGLCFLLLFLIHLFIIFWRFDSCQTNYLKIYRTDFRQIFRVGRTRPVHDQSEISISIPQGMLPWRPFLSVLFTELIRWMQAARGAAGWALPCIQLNHPCCRAVCPRTATTIGALCILRNYNTLNKPIVFLKTITEKHCCFCYSWLQKLACLCCCSLCSLLHLLFCLSVCLSVYLNMVCCYWPGRQEISMDCCMAWRAAGECG